MAEIVPLREAVAELVRDGDCGRARGVHAPDPVRRRPRAPPPGPPRARADPDDAGHPLRPDDRDGRRAAGWCSPTAAIPASGRCTASATRSSTAGRAPIEIEEHSHAGMANRYAAGAARLPFAVMRGYARDRPRRAHAASRSSSARSPASALAAVPALRARRRDRPRPGGRPRRQRAAVGDPRRAEGGRARRRALAGDGRADRRAARAAPGRRRDPGLGDRLRSRRRPGGSQPSYSLGITERDNDFYRLWDEISRDRDAFTRVDGRARAAARRRCAMSGTATRPRARSRRSSPRGGSRDARDACSSASGGRARPRSWRAMVHNPDAGAGLRVGHDRRQAVPHPALDRRRRARRDRRRRSSRCPRCSTTGSAPGRIDVAFLGAAQVDRFANLNSTVIGDYDHPKTRLPGRRRRARDRGQLRRGDRDRAARQADVRRAARLRARPSATATAPGARERLGFRGARADRGDHRSRRARARSADAASSMLTAGPRRGRGRRRCARRPAGSSRSPSDAAGRPSRRRDEELAALRELLDAMSDGVRLRGGAHAVRALRRRRSPTCGRTISPPHVVQRAARPRAGNLDPARSTSDPRRRQRGRRGQPQRRADGGAAQRACRRAVTGATVNRLCGSSLEAAIQASRVIARGEATSCSPAASSR